MMLSMMLPHDGGLDVVWVGEERVGGGMGGSSPGWAGDMDMAGTACAGTGAGEGARKGAWSPIVAAGARRSGGRGGLRDRLLLAKRDHKGETKNMYTGMPASSLAQGSA